MKKRYYACLLSIVLIIGVFISSCAHQTESPPLEELEKSETGSCSPDWQCEVWSECDAHRNQIRTCTDQNACNKDTDKPSESQKCTSSPEATPIIRLYYTYSSNPTKTNKDYTKQNFGSAYSTDGVNFVNDDGARLSGEYLTDADVFEGLLNTWIMFYSKEVSPTESDKSVLYKATSITQNGDFTIDSSFKGNYGSISSTIKVEDTWYVYSVQNGIKISTYNPTTNQLTYVKVALPGEVFDPTVIQISKNKFIMFYKSAGSAYATSSIDGLTWTAQIKIADNAQVPGAVYVNDKIYLYYGNQGNTVVRISSDGGATFSSPQIVTGLTEFACDPNPVVYE